MKANALGRQVEVLLPTAVAHGFDYSVPDGMELSAGDIVTVPFGRSESLGVVWGAGKAQIAASKMKPVAICHEQFAPLPETMRAFIDWAAWYNCAPKGSMLKMVLPVAEIAKEGRIQFEPPPDNAMQLAPLSPAQQQAADTLAEGLSKGFSVTLLDGVTGSGKTEVYFDTIARALAADPASQVLVMLPEIALSVQSLERFTRRFGYAPVIWNSDITPARKRVGWQAIASGQARVVIGARSALFLPYTKLSLLVVDEEHDTSYKQEDGVIYHARDMAVARARFEKFPVVLASATPSLESYFNARQGRYKEVTLPARHGDAVLPDIELLDMRKPIVEKSAFVSQPLRAALAAAIAKGQQGMLFLNRRGYAPLMLCRTCGHRFQCPDCSAWLVLHKSKNKPAGLPALSASHGEGQETVAGDNNKHRLECHHCGHREPVPKACPACAAEDSLHACGPGVERLLEEVHEFLPQARVAVMASDSMDTSSNLSETIADMTEGKIDLLIGTQMIAKGHHFAGLTVVGVVDADLGLAGGDLRAAEHTYQLLHQISGRAGREQLRGKVYLQSFLPEHPVMKALLSGDRDAFMQAEMEARERAEMPPLGRLAAIIVDGAKEEQVSQVARQLAAAAASEQKLHVLGPAPAPLYMLRGKFRQRLLVKAGKSINLPDYMRSWVGSVACPSSVRVRIDIDPHSFL
jgi:primosomal protein N' (replication factor Y)